MDISNLEQLSDAVC
nr:hypothetical protein [Tanacetum cinerariifolium]